MDSPRHNVVCGHGGFCQGRRRTLWRFGIGFLPLRHQWRYFAGDRQSVEKNITHRQFSHPFLARYHRFFIFDAVFFRSARLNLSTVTALLQTSPLFLALLTAFFLRERISSPLLVALLVSFVGMLFVLRPGLGGEELLGGIAALVSGLMSGFAYFNIRRLGILNEGGIRTVFYFVAFSAVFSLLLIVGYGDFSPLSGIGALLLLAIAATATGGQLALTRGLHYGHTLTASALIYSGVIFPVFWITRYGKARRMRCHGLALR